MPIRKNELRHQVLFLTLCCEGGLAGLAWLLGWLFDQPCYATLQWTLADGAWGAAASVPMIVGFVPFLTLPIKSATRIKRFFRVVIRPVFSECTWLDFIFIATLAGVGEELLFRGALQAKLGDWTTPGLGLVMTSALFGLLHPFTPAYAVLAGLIGAYLGGIWMITGNLLVPMTAHAVFDFVILTLFVKGPVRLLTGTEDDESVLHPT